MLILTRRPGEGLTIGLDQSVDPRTPMGEILGQPGIRVRVVAGRSNQVRVGIDAPVRACDPAGRAHSGCSVDRFVTSQ